MGATSGLRDRLRQPGTLVAERIPCRLKEFSGFVAVNEKGQAGEANARGS
jgi:hypothetical protein